MATYNWQQSDWPNFRFQLGKVEKSLLLFSEKQGRVSGILEALPEQVRQDTVVNMLLAEAIKTSEIEGAYPNREDVLSSIRKNLGLHINATFIKDKSAAGLGELMIDVRNTYNQPLSKEKLFEWHQMLLGTNKKMAVGVWRSHQSEIL